MMARQAEKRQKRKGERGLTQSRKGAVGIEKRDHENTPVEYVRLQRNSTGHAGSPC